MRKLIHEFAHGGFGGVLNKLLVFPHVSKWRGAAQTFAEFCANFNGSLHAVSDFLPFPLRERRNHRVKEASCRRRSVYLLLQRNHVGTALAEQVGELEEFLGIACKSGKL